MAKHLGKPESLRQKKINSVLREKISQIILEERFTGLTGLVTIHAVATTADLREAKVWFSSVGQDPEEVLNILKTHLYEIQGRLYQKSETRIVPKITFYIDSSEEFSSHINQVISKLDDG
ncbi:MAG: ribosome-binding factor A [Patescibacteria group bacterium]